MCKFDDSLVACLAFFDEKGILHVFRTAQLVREPFGTKSSTFYVIGLKHHHIFVNDGSQMLFRIPKKYVKIHGVHK